MIAARSADERDEECQSHIKRRRRRNFLTATTKRFFAFSPLVPHSLTSRLLLLVLCFRLTLSSPAPLRLDSVKQLLPIPEALIDGRPSDIDDVRFRFWSPLWPPTPDPVIVGLRPPPLLILLLLKLDERLEEFIFCLKSAWKDGVRLLLPTEAVLRLPLPSARDTYRDALVCWVF